MGDKNYNTNIVYNSGIAKPVPVREAWTAIAKGEALPLALAKSGATTSATIQDAAQIIANATDSTLTDADLEKLMAAAGKLTAAMKLKE